MVSTTTCRSSGGVIPLAGGRTRVVFGLVARDAVRLWCAEKDMKCANFEVITGLDCYNAAVIVKCRVYGEWAEWANWLTEGKSVQMLGRARQSGLFHATHILGVTDGRLTVREHRPEAREWVCGTCKNFSGAGHKRRCAKDYGKMPYRGDRACMKWEKKGRAKA